MGLGSRLIGYAVVGLVAFNLGSKCAAERRVVDEPTTPQLYNFAGVEIEDVQEPLYCVEKSEIAQYEGALEQLVER